MNEIDKKILSGCQSLLGWFITVLLLGWFITILFIEERSRVFNIDVNFRRQVWLLLFSDVSDFTQKEKAAGLFWICEEWVQEILVDLGEECVIRVQQNETER